MSDKEKQDADKYRQDHRCTTKKTPFNRNSFDFIVSFGSSIGCSLAIRCNLCRQENDITDLDTW